MLFTKSFGNEKYYRLQEMSCFLLLVCVFFVVNDIYWQKDSCLGFQDSGLISYTMSTTIEIDVYFQWH